MRNPIIVISEGDVKGNKGTIAMVNCIVNGIRKKYPDSKFFVTSKYVKDPNYSEDENIKILYDNEQAFDIPLIKLWIWWLFKKLSIDLQFLLKDKVLKIYRVADLIISASGISFHDNFGLIKIYHFSKYIQIPFFLDKTIIKFTQSIGPFSTFYNRQMAKLVFPQIDIIFARGIHSAKNLKRISINKNVEIFPDIAMSLVATKPKTSKVFTDKYLHSGKTIIGLSPNNVCKQLDKKNQYVKSLKVLCNHIIEKYENSIILFIPHTFESANSKLESDLNICEDLLNHLEIPERCGILDTLNYTPEETKWLISKCDFFIGSRFHSLIASVSSLVPSIAIGWHWKYEEMMKWVELRNNTIQYWELTPEKLLSLFEINFNNRDSIKRDLSEIVPRIKDKALSAIDLINEEIDEIIKKNDR